MISQERTTLSVIGRVLQAAAGIGILVCFAGFMLSGKTTVDSFGKEGNPVAWWIGAVVCMAAAILGGVLQHFGTRGRPGSGAVRCGKCGSLEAQTARFCSQCGAPM